MSLTKSTFRLADGGNFETSTSTALAQGHANEPANSNRARRRAFRLIHLWRAESIFTKPNMSIGVRLSMERWTTQFDGGERARIHGRTLTKYRANRGQR